MNHLFIILCSQLRLRQARLAPRHRSPRLHRRRRLRRRRRQEGRRLTSSCGRTGREKFRKRETALRKTGRGIQATLSCHHNYLVGFLSCSSESEEPSSDEEDDDEGHHEDLESDFRKLEMERGEQGQVYTLQGAPYLLCACTFKRESPGLL